VGAAADPGRAAAERRFRFELAAHPGSPAQARHLTRARLTGWSVCEDTCDSAALVVSELVTNAIVHTASRRVVCELHDGEDLVRIAVRDEGCAPGEPHPSPRPEEEHGRGLLLVDALCHSWGAHEHGPGLLVWAELPRGADTPPRNDLGWGARPKPGPPGPGDEETTRTHSAAMAGPTGSGRGTDVHAPAQRGGAGAYAPAPRRGSYATGADAEALADIEALAHVQATLAEAEAKPDVEPDHGTATGAMPDGEAEARGHGSGALEATCADPDTGRDVGSNRDRGRT
jgi:hypothetical protein